MTTIKFKFNIREKVLILPLEKTEGEVVSLWISASSDKQFEVRYFQGGDEKTVYFFEHKLIKKRKKNKIGFKDVKK